MTDRSANNPNAGLRPSGKRQVTGQSAVAPGSARKAAPEVVKTSRNPFAAIIDFFRGVFSETGKVIWPTGKEMVNYTIIVLAFLVVLIAIVASVDWAASWGLQKLFA